MDTTSKDQQDDAIHHIKKFLKTRKTDEVNETDSIPTLKNPKEREHTTTATRIRNQLHEVGKREKLDPQYNPESGTQFFSSGQNI